LYTLGSFLFGIQVAMVLGFEIVWFEVLVLSLLLTVPVNALLYSLNDYFDFESDKQNPKKDAYEYRSAKPDQRLLIIALGSLLVISLGMLYQDLLLVQLFILWILIILTYNIPPLRFKARPGLDMLFALNFPLWGFVGYIAVANQWPSLESLVPVTLLAMMFHLYTAIHDMPFDKKAGVHTSAVYVGSARLNIIFCILLTIGAFASLIYFGWFWIGILVLLYAIFLVLHLCNNWLSADLLEAYKYFIGLHYIVGFLASLILFMYI